MLNFVSQYKVQQETLCAQSGCSVRYRPTIPKVRYSEDPLFRLVLGFGLWFRIRVGV